MAKSFIQSNSRNQGSVSFTTIAYNSNNNAGNFLYCQVVLALVGTTCVVTDSNGNVWTEIDHMDGSSASIWHFYAKNCLGGANTVTITPGASTTIRGGIAEYGGIDISSPIDQFAQNTGTGTALTSGSITPTVDNCLFLSGWRWSTSQIFTQGTNYTLRESQPAGQLWAMQDYLSTAIAAPQNATASLGSSATWNGLIVSVKPSIDTTPVTIIPNTSYRLYEYTYQC